MESSRLCKLGMMYAYIYYNIIRSLKEVIFMYEIHPVDPEDTRNYLKESLIGVVTIFASVFILGRIADKVFDSEAKAEEARKQGYDI